MKSIPLYLFVRPASLSKQYLDLSNFHRPFKKNDNTKCNWSLFSYFLTLFDVLVQLIWKLSTFRKCT